MDIARAQKRIETVLSSRVMKSSALTCTSNSVSAFHVRTLTAKKTLLNQHNEWLGEAARVALELACPADQRNGSQKLSAVERVAGGQGSRVDRREAATRLSHVF